ncbi:DUF4134 family protein [Dyadobacter sp. SG02]|uniref:DUF4134 family protein n=1 Tax=Dyadobacter sp. SG02 TaxID=1855291 RepID=UPI0015A618FD|nr:DUF4134 family protein [Dyadobacter sp. SG02]
MLTLIAVCSLIAGMRIYQSVQRGDEFEAPAIRWGLGLVLTVVFFYAVDTFIYNSSDISNAGAIHFTGFTYAGEAYQAAMVFGLVIAITGIFKVYRKFRDGDDDVYDFMLKWFGSLMFLFMMGWIIDTVLGG